MRQAGVLTVISVLAPLAVRGAEPAAPPPRRGAPADFKLVSTLYGVQKAPVKTIEMVVRNGAVFRFDAEPSLEVIILEPAAGKLELLDLDRKMRAEVGLKRLDTFQANLHDAIAEAVEKRAKQGGKANEVAARMSRDLIDTRYTPSYDPATRTVRLSNTSVQFEGRGEPEPDRARLDLIADALAAFMKLESMREPGAIPPNSKLEALRVMTSEHQLRPTEMSFVYRLAGPPRKYRWTFRLEPALTEREVAAIGLIEKLRPRCRLERFEKYERSEKK